MYIGKGIIIAAIIITASLSFALGFFVGKSFRPSAPDQPAACPQQSAIAQPNIENIKKDEAALQPVSEEKTQPRETLQPQPLQPVEIQKVPESQKAKKMQETDNIQKTRETAKASKTRKYTVQVEAFKNSSTADALKEKLNKKGYKASVISVKTKKRENLFKVIVGEFNNRKEAEVMSVKLKKTENLQHTFVTFRSE